MTIFYPVSRPSLTSLEQDYLSRVVQSGWISSIGEYIEMFEKNFAAFCGTRHAITVSNGTAALHLALKGLGVGPGDEVIVPDLSFIATANAVLLSGATPVFADVDIETLCLSPADLERCRSVRTRAVIPVHLYGHPADMNAITDFANHYNLAVIEDAAEAHGAEINGRKVGGIGNCGTFSFYANKNLTTGEGGMITTDDDALAARLRMLRDHAMSTTRRYWHEEVGYNYRMTNMQAALGCAQLQRSEELLRARASLFACYSRELKDIDGVILNRHMPWATPCYWMVCVELDGLFDEKRAQLMAALKMRGVDSRPYFYPMSDMPFFKQADTPVAHDVYQRGLNLPTYVGLTEADVKTICKILREEWIEIKKC